MGAVRFLWNKTGHKNVEGQWPKNEPLWSTGVKNLEHTADIVNVYGLFLTLQVWIQKGRKSALKLLGFCLGYK